MTRTEWTAVSLFVAMIFAVLGFAAFIEYRGYCVSDYACTANITPKAFR